MIIAVHLNVISLFEIVCESDAIFSSLFVFLHTSDQKPINSFWPVTSDIM